MEFRQCIHDPGMFVRNKDGSMCIIIVWVDDLLVGSKRQSEIERILDQLEEKLKIKKLGRVASFLKTNVNYDLEKGVVRMDQKFYMETIMKRFELEGLKKSSLPMEKGLELKKVKTKMDVPYRELVGAMLYIGRVTRPDVAYAVGYMARFGNGYGEEHWKRLKKVVRYVAGTMDYKLQMERRNLSGELRGSADASYGEESTIGYTVMMGRTVVDWYSGKLRTAVTSSTEAEIYAL